MGLYAGNELHSTSNHVGGMDEADKHEFRTKLANNPGVTLEALDTIFFY